jgi:Domain of unknown function (DUF5060)
MNLSKPFHTSILLLILIGTFAQSALGQDATPQVTPTLSYPTQGELYSLMTFPAVIDPAAYKNPFDIADIQLLGIFQPPSGQQVVVQGFWIQPYEDRCEQPCTVENLQATGDPIWQVRFAPQEVGDWKYTLQVQDGGNVLSSTEGSFTIVPSDNPGFIRVGANKRYFQYSDGQPFILIGHNLKWSWRDEGGLVAYRDWLKQLSHAGGNYARLFIDEPWFIALEPNAPVGDYRAAQDAAARLDLILDAAAQYGIELQLVVLWHQSLSIYNGPPVLIPDAFPRPDMNADWDNNPYNLLYGGPLGGAGFFFTNQQANDFFKRRLRYIVARWGYSSNIFAWEIIDEIDHTSGYNAQAANAWLQDMAGYLKQIDPQRHLVTAGTENFDPVIASNTLLDFTTGQLYQRRPIETVGDQTTLTINTIRQNLAANPIPTLLTDYSLNPWFEPTGDDPQGVHFQDTLWSALFSGAAGGAASDWWFNYVIPQGLQRYYRPLASFVTGIDWPDLNLQPAEAGLISADYSQYKAVHLNNFNRLLTARPVDVVTHTITADGVFPPLDNVPSYLYGQVYNNQLSQAQIYRVTVPVESYLEIGINKVSTQAGARLSTRIDNQEVVNLSLPVGSKETAVRVPLPAGEHEITLDNLGDDWLELSYLEIGLLQAPARALTLRDSDAGIALAWLQHRDYTWDQVAAGAQRQPVLFTYQLNRMPPGLYSVEIWNPLTGDVFGEELVRVGDDGILSAELVPMDAQLALRIFRQPESSAVDATASSTAVATPALTDTIAPPTATSVPTETEIPIIVQTNTPRPTTAP